MILYLIRHGIAVDREAFEGADADRPLTPEGVRRMRRSARGLQRLGLQLDAVWTSPLVRARQTADILADVLSCKESLREEKSLEPAAAPSAVVDQLRGQSKDARIALVGHEPHLGQLATFLLTGSRRTIIEFKKGGAAAIEITSFRRPPRANLLWLLTPRHMRRIKAD
jgi:phosphohistidine phosphatase